ncbi:MAG: heliorhodopsin HeR [Candidatus Bathyarchaeota archaeon]|nr:heliorhodopsin HeR [Candidatus Bathyarchaeota archaeon]
MDYKERQEIIANSPISFGYLKKFNIGAGILQLANGIAILALTFLLTWPKGTDIYTFYLSFTQVNPASPAIIAAPNPQVFFTIGYLGILLAAFPLISAFAHFIIAFPKNKSYNENLKKGMNPYRWYEYAFSSSIMIWVISTFVGILDFWSLAMIFVLNAMMIMFGYLMEVINQKTEKTSWAAFNLGSISGGFPWVVLFAYFTGAVISSEGNVPAFVYTIFAVYLVLFMSFAVNMALQYKGVGRWRDYLYGERAYIVLSFVAKTVLVWLVFAGLFKPF